VSALRIRLQALMQSHVSPGATCLEDWMLDVANARGATFVQRVRDDDGSFAPPDEDVLPNEDLVVAICQVNNQDRPQLLRAAAQLISQGKVEAERLLRVARRERGELVLRELARQALRVDERHAVWSRLAHGLGPGKEPRSPIVHWTRLAVPVPDERGINAKAWRLIA
jgi:hypothetical protein